MLHSEPLRKATVFRWQVLQLGNRGIAGVYIGVDEFENRNDHFVHAKGRVDQGVDVEVDETSFLYTTLPRSNNDLFIPATSSPD